jgi:transcriptional regulator with XRE-family HTH domain
LDQLFGAQLRNLRLQAGLSQDILAARAGISAASIAAYERNRRRRPYPHTLMALASALGLTPAEATDHAVRP